MFKKQKTYGEKLVRTTTEHAIGKSSEETLSTDRKK